MKTVEITSGVHWVGGSKIGTGKFSMPSFPPCPPMGLPITHTWSWGVRKLPHRHGEPWF